MPGCASACSCRKQEILDEPINHQPPNTMTDIPPPQKATIRCMLEAHKERCMALGKPLGIDGIESVMLEITRELGGLADYILGVWNSASGQQEPLTDSRPDFLHTGRIFTHLLELMNRRGLGYPDDAVFTHVDNPYRHREGYEIPISIHFSAIARSITTFGWKDARESGVSSAAAEIIVALWSIGRSLNFNPEAALVYIAGGIQERQARPVDPSDLVSAEDYERMVGNTESR